MLIVYITFIFYRVRTQTNGFCRYVCVYVYAGACVHAYVYSKIYKFLIYARKKCILQSVVGKMKKICIFICVCQKKAVPLHSELKK